MDVQTGSYWTHNHITQHPIAGQILERPIYKRETQEVQGKDVCPEEAVG